MIKNLKTAGLENDSSNLVKQQAQKALTTITGQSGTTNTGEHGDHGHRHRRRGRHLREYRAWMSSEGRLGERRQAPGVDGEKSQARRSRRWPRRCRFTWPGGAPSKQVLAQKSVSGFYVDGTLNALTVKTSGSSATITCKVSMLLADFPDKNMFGFLNGGASVSASGDEREQAMASEDCVSAVMEDLIAKKIVPTICSKTSASCP